MKDKFDKSGDPERQRSLDAVIESMKRHEAFSLTLKLDKSFSLVFGSGTAEEMAEFKPMTVRTKLLDLQMGLRAIFRISDFDRFAEYFLTDERVATTLKIAGKLQPTIQNAVQAVMQDREVEGTSIPADVVELITAKIVAAGDQFYGLTLEARRRSGGVERGSGTPAQPEPRALSFGAGAGFPAPDQRFPQPAGDGDQRTGYRRRPQRPAAISGIAGGQQGPSAGRRRAG